MRRYHFTYRCLQWSYHLTLNKNNIMYRCGRTNEVTAWGWDRNGDPRIKNNPEEFTKAGWIIIGIRSDASNQQGVVWRFSGESICWREILRRKHTIYVVNVIGNGFQIKPIELFFQGNPTNEEIQLRGSGHRIKEEITSSRARILYWYNVYFTYWINLKGVNTSDGSTQPQQNWRCLGLPQATLSPRMNEGEWFAANIFTGTAKQLLKLQLTLTATANCLDNTIVSVMAAQNILQLSCS